MEADAGFAPANRHRLLPPDSAGATYNKANGLWCACLLVDGDQRIEFAT